MPAAESVCHWLQLHFVEIIAVITGLLFVILAVRKNPLLWLFGIISSGLYVWIFYHSGLYAYAVLYIYYVVIGLYGWYNWLGIPKKKQKEQNLPVQRASKSVIWLSITIAVVLVIPITFLLKEFTSSGLAIADACLTAGGFVATWLLTQKYIEQWLFWIVIDLASLGVMIYQELYLSALLFLIYTILAIKGFVEWKKDMNTQPTA